jgi:hypothetical protein
MGSIDVVGAGGETIALALEPTGTAPVGFDFFCL